MDTKKEHLAIYVHFRGLLTGLMEKVRVAGSYFLEPPTTQVSCSLLIKRIQKRGLSWQYICLRNRICKRFVDLHGSRSFLYDGKKYFDCGTPLMWTMIYDCFGVIIVGNCHQQVFFFFSFCLICHRTRFPTLGASKLS